MNKFSYYIFILILLFLGCKRTPKKVDIYNNPKDSLNYFLEIANNDSIPYSVRDKYNKKALSFTSQKNNDSLNRVYYFKIANRFFNMNNFEDYRKTTLKIIKNATVSKDSINLAKAYNYMIDYHIKFKNSDSIYWYNNHAEKLYSKLKDHVNIQKVLFNKAVLQHNAGDFLGGEKTVFEILKHLRHNNDAAMLYECYNLLGVINAELAEYDLAKKHYDLALNASSNPELLPEYQLEAFTLNNIGILNLYQKKYGEAIKVFEIALSQKNLKKDKPLTFARVKDNYGYSKFKHQDSSNLPQLFFESIKIKDSLGDFSGIVLSKTHISEYYAFKKDTIKALLFARQANELAVKNEEIRDQLSTLKQLANVDPKNALKYSTQYFKINDSLQIAERKARNKFARIEYETEELTIEKDKLIEQRKTLIYIALGILLIGIFIFVIRFQAAKNRELTLVQEQQKANEEIYQLMINQQNKVEEVRQAEKKRIAQELHDGILGKLFGTRMNLGVLNTKTDEKGISDRSGYIDELKTLEQEIREISHDLNSEKAAVFNNFVLMVNSFLETQKTVCKANITSSIDAKIEWAMVGNMAKINFYRILQEAFQNINKYAEAQNVSVTFTKNLDFISLKIEDDGIGFIYTKKKKGIGLQNMDARMTSSGGTMQISSEPGNGTTLLFELPLNTNT